MSSLIERTAVALRGTGPGKGAAGTSAVKAPDVEAKLREAQDALAALEARHGEAALDDLLGEDGAASRLAALVKQMDAARGTVTTLRAALATARERDAAAERAARASLHKTQVAAVKSNLEKRDAAGEAFTIAAAEAIKQFRILVERSGKAHAANPIGGTWPDGALTHFSELKLAVQQELYRLDGHTDPMGDTQAFPGAAVHDYNKVGQSDKITPLADELKANSAYIIAKLTGRPVS
jgi:hypothetical protein